MTGACRINPRNDHSFVLPFLSNWKVYFELRKPQSGEKLGLSFTLSLSQDFVSFFVSLWGSCNYVKDVEDHPSWAAIIFLVFFEVCTSELTDACRCISFVVPFQSKRKVHFDLEKYTSIEVSVLNFTLSWVRIIDTGANIPHKSAHLTLTVECDSSGTRCYLIKLCGCPSPIIQSALHHVGVFLKKKKKILTSIHIDPGCRQGLWLDRQESKQWLQGLFLQPPIKAFTGCELAIQAPLVGGRQAICEAPLVN